MPPISQYIPGMGLVNYIFVIDYLRILTLAILLPVFLGLISSTKTLKLFSAKTDFFVVFHILILCGLQFRETTITDSIRQSLIYFIDYFVVYFVISRYIKTAEQLKLVFYAFLFAAIPAALIGGFEAIKHWLVYSSLESALHVSWNYGGYLARDSSLRALSSFGHSIIFGYCMVIVFGFYLYMQTQIKNTKYKKIGFIILAIGMIAPISRGPWVGAVALLGIFLLLGKNGIANAIKFISALLFAFVLATQLPGGEKLVNLIPFVGKTDAGNVEYREKLIDVSLLVVARNPWFGKINFAEEPEMKQMVQGEGIIDVVNSYIATLLQSGYFGLFTFIGIFISAILITFKAFKKVRSQNIELANIGRTLLAGTVSSAIMIATVSNQLIIPYMYFITAGMCIAYSQIVKKMYSE